MKNKKIIFGIILLFAITGIYNIQNVSAFTDDAYIPPLSYIGYKLANLDQGDIIEINVIDSSGTINVYIMNEAQYLEAGGLVWYYLYRWKDITHLSNFNFEISIDGDYYIVLYNKALLTGRTVYVDITIDYYYEPYDPPYDPYDQPAENIFWNLLLFVVIPIVAIILVIAIPIIIIRKHKRKTPEEVIIQKEVPIYCSECGAEIDKTKEFCSKCGVKIK